MDFDSQWFVFCIAMLLTGVFSYAARTSLLIAMKQTASTQNQDEELLLPAELAYLMRPGDSSHCLIVMVVDLVQKGLKRKIDSNEHELLIARYEQLVWEKVTAYIKDWSTQKAQELVPELKTTNPIIMVRGFWKMRDWFTKTLASTLKDLIKDPLSIRKYFSPAGLTRLFVSIASSGIRDQVSSEIQASLLQKGLLVDQTRRNTYANYFVAAAFLHLITASILFAHFSEVTRWQAIATFVIFTLFNGIFLRIMAALPIFLPFYEELSNVLDSVKREGVRIGMMRMLLKFLRSAYWAIIITSVAILVAIQAFVFGLAFHFHASDWWLNMLGIICVSVNFILIADLFFLSNNVRAKEQLSSRGEEQLSQHHRELRSTSLIQAFSKTLSDPSYNEQLSDIIAIYGIETLLLIA